MPVSTAYVKSPQTSGLEGLLDRQRPDCVNHGTTPHQSWHNDQPENQSVPEQMAITHDETEKPRG